MNGEGDESKGEVGEVSNVRENEKIKKKDSIARKYCKNKNSEAFWARGPTDGLRK